VKRWNLFIPDDLIAEAKALADKKGVSVAEVVRIALTKYLEAVRRAKEAKHGA
jgi:antitoxin component of RelBE/YafQ-DinJ toxin-antitoxin module